MKSVLTQSSFLLKKMVGVLSVSGEVDSECRGIIESMKKLNLCGDVTPKKSIYKKIVENGCRIIVVGNNEENDVSRLWYDIKRNHKFTCAHVELEKSVSGCVFDVLSPSRCPSQA